MKLFFDVVLAGVAVLTLGYATVRAEVRSENEQIWLENPFYIACTEYAQQDADTRHTIDVLHTAALSRASAVSDDRYNYSRGQLSCTRSMQLLLQINALDLRGEGLRALLPLAGLRNLTTLMLDDNDIIDVAPLGQLTGLRFLSLSHNRIQDVSPLRHLENLTHLVAAANSITHVGPLVHIGSLLRLDITANPVRDFVALQQTRGSTLRIVGP